MFTLMLRLKVKKKEKKSTTLGDNMERD